MDKETFIKKIINLGFEILIDNGYRLHFKNEKLNCNYFPMNDFYLINEDIEGFGFLGMITDIKKQLV